MNTNKTAIFTAIETQELTVLAADVTSTLERMFNRPHVDTVAVMIAITLAHFLGDRPPSVTRHFLSEFVSNSPYLSAVDDVPHQGH